MGHELISYAFGAISRHFGQLGSYFEHILRIAANFRRIEAGVTVEQLAHLGFSASKGTREARRRAGSRHFTTRRLTLNQRVRGSSPRGLTTLYMGVGWHPTPRSCVWPESSYPTA